MLVRILQLNPQSHILFAIGRAMHMQNHDIPYAIRSLPPFPETALRAIEVLQDPNTSAKDFVEVIKYDQSITANVLRVVNSAYYSLPSKVNSLEQATAFLGSEAVMQLLLVSGSLTYFENDLICYGLKAEKLLAHSVSCGLACRALAEKTSPKQSAVFFTAGLLHDIGKVVLNSFVEEQYLEIVKMVESDSCSLLQAEREVLGTDHAQVGGEIASKWGLPSEIAGPVSIHHEPQKAQNGDVLTQVVYLADNISRIIIGVKGAERWSFKKINAALVRCRLQIEDLDNTIGMVEGDMKKLRNLFQM